MLEGKAIFIYKIGEKLKAPLSSRRNVGISAKALKEIKLDASREAVMIDVPKGIGYLIKNPYLKEAKFINICDYPWRAGDNETITPDFEGY